MTHPAVIEFQDLVDRLRERADDVAAHYVPAGRRDGPVWRFGGVHLEAGNSAWMNLTGHLRGRWRDAATGESGDCLDLIQHAIAGDRRAAVEEARRFLGLAPAATPEERRAQLQAAERRRRDAARREAAREAAELERAEHVSRQAQAMFIRARPIEGTPAAAYLAARAVGIDALGRAPAALRFDPACHYKRIDTETGEIHEGRHPAMLAAIHGPALPDRPPEFLGVHRTYLSRRPDGTWGKLDAPDAKKVLGRVRGGFIRVWSGWGPRGGKGPPLSAAPDDARVYVTEGIEDALSAAVLIGRQPHRYVVAAVSLGNLARIGLPDRLRDVTLIADQDQNPQARAAFERAVEALNAPGRVVRVWRNRHGGKDLNDALQAAARQRREGVA